MPTQTQEIAALGHYWLLESRYMVLWQGSHSNCSFPVPADALGCHPRGQSVTSSVIQLMP